MKEQSQPRGNSPEEKVGRALGKAFLRVKKTKIWKDTATAYREGREGKR